MSEDAEEFLKQYPNLISFIPFLQNLNSESHRGRVLIAAAYLEQQLGDTIAAFLIQGAEAQKLLEGFNAPLGSFSARTSAAFALGVISRIEFDDLCTIRKIRNEFAHNHRTTFAEQKIRDLCTNLKLAAKPFEGVAVAAQGQFTSAAVAVILNLVNRPHYVSEHRLQYGNWKY